ncbi:MAG TPA: hypothetical protein VFQ15_03360, partial [Jiangellaceae bacterium]|nr:hypothetical protein [Jiangellaceae bacterium]
MNDASARAATRPALTPDPVRLAEIELALFGIGSGHVQLPIAPGVVAGHASVLVTDAEGAPVAALDITAVSDDGQWVTGTPGPVAGREARGPFAALRIPPSQAGYERAAAVVGHGPVDAFSLAAAAAEPDRAVLIIVLDGPRVAPGPDVADVVVAAVTLRDELRRTGRVADVIVVPAPEYGDERDGVLAGRIATAYGVRLVRPDRSPDLDALRRGLAGRSALPVDDWPEASLNAWRRWHPPRHRRGLVVLF